MTRQLLLCLVAVVGTVANANAQDAGSKRKCTPAVIDTMHYAASVYRDCDVEKPAKLKHEERPDVRNATAGCIQVDMLFIVDSTGKVVPGTASLQSTNEPDYALLVLASLGKWRYEPARREKAPVAQLVLARHSVQNRLKVVVSTTRPRITDRAPPGGPQSIPCK